MLAPAIFNDFSPLEVNNSDVKKPTYEMVEQEMTRIEKLQRVCAIVAIATLSGALIGAPASNAATKSITCYKGATSKVVKAAAPKCPAGYSTTKPAATKTTPPAAATSSTSKSFTLNATYTGKISSLWSDSDVQATVTATGTGTTLGLTQLTGSGSSAPSGQDAGISGAGSISDGTNTLKANFDPSATAHAKDGAAPTSVAISGNMIITGGTGKYAGATGTLKFTGTFPVSATAAGTKDSGALSLTVTGTFTTK